MDKREAIIKILNEFSWYCAEHCQDSEETADEILALDQIPILEQDEVAEHLSKGTATEQADG